MKYEVLSLIACVVAAVSAHPGSAPSVQQSFTIEEAKASCPSGDVACCQNTEVLQADGILGNLLAKGALNNLLGVGDSACAKTSLIENLNILGLTTEGVNGVSCSSTTACCSGDGCVAISK